jgi:type III restriction enzyme
MGAVAEEQFIPLEAVNEIRRRVGKWRADGYPGATGITRQLLRYWNREDRFRPLFFCQREAVETIIWLAESPAARSGIDIPLDGPLRRYCCKMSTGSGKTIIMAMVAAWSILNRVQDRQDTRFSDAVLILCPNLTVKERLQVLLPSNPDNYYQHFEIVPGNLMESLNRGKFLITNWHALAEDRDPKRGVVQRGKESDEAFARRVLDKDLGAKTRILVLNDEAHHAYREAQANVAEPEQLELPKMSAAEKKQAEEEKQEARIWVTGLDKIGRARGINMCVDVSATPFYIAGSGYVEGTPLPWIVSDFGLVDAIECGIVKIPRIPVADDSGALNPKYFRLWDNIMQALPAGEREGPRRKAKPESVWREAQPAAITLASEWQETFEGFEHAGVEVPPVIIVVCDNTDLAREVYETISRDGLGFTELKNIEGTERTLRIDSKLLADAEAREEGQSKQDAAAILREKVSTVGKLGKPGEQIRCVVSVSMLTEGWDAQNVTHILGIRPFRSQLLCEQVVGRGLRRTNYDDFTVPEYCDVYGIPFEVIPVKKQGVALGRRAEAVAAGAGGEGAQAIRDHVPPRRRLRVRCEGEDHRGHRRAADPHRRSVEGADRSPRRWGRRLSRRTPGQKRRDRPGVPGPQPVL